MSIIKDGGKIEYPQPTGAMSDNNEQKENSAEDKMQELVSSLNKASEQEGYTSWSQVLRDFDISPADVNRMIYSAIQSQVTPLQGKTPEELLQIRDGNLKTLSGWYFQSRKESERLQSENTALSERISDLESMLAGELHYEQMIGLEQENTALKLEVETGQGIVMKLLKECEHRKTQLDKYNEALKRIANDDYDTWEEIPKIAEQALKEKP